MNTRLRDVKERCCVLTNCATQQNSDGGFPGLNLNIPLGKKENHEGIGLTRLGPRKSNQREKTQKNEPPDKRTVVSTSNW